MTTKKKVLVAIPQRLLEQADLLAEFRSQTRSELIREALRSHIEASQAFAPARPAMSLVSPLRKDEVLLAN